jgi:hypothetical protein
MDQVVVGPRDSALRRRRTCGHRVLLIARFSPSAPSRLRPSRPPDRAIQPFGAVAPAAIALYRDVIASCTMTLQ